MIHSFIVNIFSLIASYISINNKKAYNNFNKNILPQILLTFAIVFLLYFIHGTPNIGHNKTLFLLGSGIAFIFAYMYQYALLLFTALVMLLPLLGAEPLSANMYIHFMLYAIMLFCIATFQTNNKSFKKIYYFFSLTCYTVILIISIIRKPLSIDPYQTPNTQTLFLLACIVLTLLTTLWLQWKREKKITVPLIALLFTISAWAPLAPTATIRQILLQDALTILQLIGLLFVGLELQKKIIINISTFFLFIYILARSYTLFKMANLEIGVFLIIAGTAIMTLGYILEKSRRTFIAMIKQKKT